MSKFLALAAAALIATPAVAANDNSRASHDLRLALHQMIQANGDNPPGQDKRPFDPDMGDDNASPRAIFEVCAKSTPAAERSAICRSEPISPG